MVRLSFLKIRSAAVCLVSTLYSLQPSWYFQSSTLPRDIFISVVPFLILQSFHHLLSHPLLTVHTDVSLRTNRTSCPEQFSPLPSCSPFSSALPSLRTSAATKSKTVCVANPPCLNMRRRQPLSLPVWLRVLALAKDSLFLLVSSP